MFKLARNILRLIQLGLRLFIGAIPQRMVLCCFYSRYDYRKYEASMEILGHKVTKFLQYSGPTFIKLGQALSTRSDLTGEIISKQLSKLQDKLHPFAYELVKRQIEYEFKSPINDIFDSFSENAIAAASIAQVHKAKLKSGEWVAVKVLRPKIAKRFKSDLELFSTFVDFLELFGSLKRLRLREVLATLRDIVKLELDFRFEASAADEIRTNTAQDEGIRIPKVYWHVTSQNVLTTEWIDGIPITDSHALISQGFDLHEIARKLAVAFFNQAYRDGFFHADLHPGNLFVDNQGNVVMVDFGIVGMLSKNDRKYIAEILYGFITQDYQRVSDIHFKAGYVPGDKDAKLFALACRSIGEPIVGLPVNEISIAQLLKQLFEITERFDMQTQTQLLLLQKTMVTIEGVGMSIYPEVNMWQLAEPWVKDWAKDNFSAKSKIKDALMDSADFLCKLPDLYTDASQALKLWNERNLENKNNPAPKKYKFYALSFLLGVACVVLIQLSI